MNLKIVFFFYIILFSFISFWSYKKGIYLLWMTLLFVPWMILVQGIAGGMSIIVVLSVVSICSELLTSRDRLLYNFISSHNLAVITYLVIVFSVLLFSEGTPIRYQFMCLVGEIAFLLFGFQTYLLVRNDRTASKTLRFLVCFAIIFNFLYSLCFEILLRINPAGLPLYVLLGIDSNEFIVDMIDSQRGMFEFRLQSIYGHPLSLGQYLLILLPVFFINRKLRFRWLYIILTCFLVILTGSRSSIFPLFIILSFYLFQMTKRTIVKTMMLITIGIFISLEFVPNKILDRSVTMIATTIQFWDDEKQNENDIRGSSMEMRSNQQLVAIEEIESTPVFGKGYGYRDYYIYKHNQLHPELLGFESVLLLYLVERGWLGLLFYFAVLLFLFKQYSTNVGDRKILIILFTGYIISIIMTGVRPASLLFLCLSGSIIYGQSDKLPINNLK